MRTKGETTKQILLLLLAGALTTSPTKSQRIWREIFRLYFKKVKLPKVTTPEMVRRRFHYLRSAQLISWKEFPSGEIKITLTKEGKKKALQYRLEDLSIPKPRLWDRKWRLVIFDIPESKRRARDALREALNRLGFLQLQKSVWVHPFPCENEIDFIAQVFDVDQYLFLAEATVKPDRILRDWFHLP